jgi:NADH-quinone oxidoreductase subunit L
LFLAGDNILEAARQVPTWVKLLPLVMGALGLGLSWVFYIWKPRIPKTLAETNSPIYNFLLNKWYFDELYELIFIRPAKWIGYQFWKIGDGKIIDGFGPDGVSGAIAWVAGKARRVQTGYLYHYAFVMLIGVVALLTWYGFQPGGVQ